MTTLKVGILGYGMRAGLSRSVNAPGNDAEIAMICEISERGKADAAKAYPSVPITESTDELFAAVDAVMVLLPDNLHAEYSIKALNAGVAVFCEKPLATTVEDADAVLRAAYESGSKLYVGHNMRHMPVVTAMREIIQSGRIGEVKAVWCRHFVGHGGDFYFKDWHADRSKSTSLLLQKGAHDIDVIHWLAGAYTNRVSGMGELSVYGDLPRGGQPEGARMFDWYSLDNWPPTEQDGFNDVVDVEDISQVNMRLDGGILASYEQCHFTPDYWRNYTVIGTKGRIENYGDGSGDTIGLWNKRHAGFAQPDEVIEVPEAEGGHGGADPRLVAEFIRFVRDGGATNTSPIAARQAVAVGVLAADSIRTDQGAREVPALPEELVAYFEQGQPARENA